MSNISWINTVNHRFTTGMYGGMVVYENVKSRINLIFVGAFNS